MKIKIIETGWETFTGDFGPVPFIDGVSSREVTPMEAARLANLVRIEDALDHANPSTSQAVLDSHCISMDGEIVLNASTGELTTDSLIKRIWTREELLDEADKTGIAGIRKIAEPYGVKDTGIVALIDKIIVAQTPPAPVVEPAPAPVEPVVPAADQTDPTTAAE